MKINLECPRRTHDRAQSATAKLRVLSALKLTSDENFFKSIFQQCSKNFLIIDYMLFIVEIFYVFMACPV